MGSVTRKIFEERARELNAGQVMLETVVGAMLAARTTLQTEYTKLHKSMLAIVRDDDVCRRMMTAPGVGPVVEITFKTAVDDPKRISKSKAVGAAAQWPVTRTLGGNNQMIGAQVLTKDREGVVDFVRGDKALVRYPDKCVALCSIDEIKVLKLRPFKAITSINVKQNSYMNSFHNAIQFSDLQREWFFETEESRNRFVLDHI